MTELLYDPSEDDNDAVLDAEHLHRGQWRIAYRLALAKADELLYVHGIGWHVWDGVRWALDATDHATQEVSDVLRAARHEACDLPEDERKALWTDVNKCETANGTAGVLKLAASLPQLKAAVSDMDADPYLLNVANGTLDLRTMQLRQHDPADRITKVCAAAYQPHQTSTMWETFLRQVLPDESVRAYLQRMSGVALLGTVTEHVLPILTGKGANGKSVFYTALITALGDYADTLESDLFLHREGAHPTGEMDLLGLRLGVVSETDEGRKLAAATMKRLTGGDRIRARRMRQDFVSFDPSHTAMLITNHLPKVRGDDPAVWRRIRVIPFGVVIPPAERNPKLAEQLTLDADAILTWAIAGYEDYVAGGMQEPAAVLASTDAYRLDSDAVQRFVDEACVTSTPNLNATTTQLWDAWQKWCLSEGVDIGGQKQFREGLDRLGYPVDKGSSRRVRRGIGIKVELSDDEQTTSE